MKPPVWRKAARRDTADAAYWYGTQAGQATGEQFLAAIHAGLNQLAAHPASGALRYAAPLNLDGLRFWPIAGFPYLIFYFERENHVDVWRVLHAQRDVPAWMGEGESQ